MSSTSIVFHFCDAVRSPPLTYIPRSIIAERFARLAPTAASRFDDNGVPPQDFCVV